MQCVNGLFYKISIQSPSQLGKYTTYDKSSVPWKPTKLHVVFDVWSDDDLLKTSPYYFVTNRLFQSIVNKNFSGIEVGLELETEASLTFKGLYPNKIIPEFYLLNITGIAYVDDFGLEKPNKLIISEKVFSFLKNYNLSDAKIEKAKGYN